MKNNTDNNQEKWTIFNKYPEYREIIASLKEIPQNWSLTPIQNKNPYRKGWQSEPTLERSRLAEILKHGEQLISKKTNKPYTAYASGYGLRTGNGLLAIDIDGHSARLILERILEHDIPQTVEWSSGKDGRSQILFSVPDNLSFTRYIITEYEGVKADKGEMLEFRYEKCSSALPPSYHPETKGYRWINSPNRTPVAIAPLKILYFLSVLAQQEQERKEAKAEAIRKRRLERAKQTRTRHLGLPQVLDMSVLKGEIKLESILQESCDRLNTDIYDWSGHNFYETATSLQGCCPNHDSHSGRSFHVNKEDLTWYCFGCNVGGGAVQYKEFVANGKTEVKGKRFVEIVKELADQANIVFPEPHQRDWICSLTESIPHAKNNAESKETQHDTGRTSLGGNLPTLRLDMRGKPAHPSRAGQPLTKLRRFKIWLNAIAQGLSKFAYKGFGQSCLSVTDKIINSSSINYSPGAPIDWEYCAENNIKIIYSQRDRAKLWAEINNKFTLDTSATGTGKSHASGQYKTEKGKVWVLSQDHRNPTTEPLEQNKTDIPTRNIGIKHDHTRVTPKNQPYRHNIKLGEKPDEPANCHNALLFHLASSKGYSFDGANNPICGNCIYSQWREDGKSKCAGSYGDGYGYKYLRAKALSYSELRGHIDSLPSNEDYDFSKDIAIVDEATTLIQHNQTLTARLADLDKWLLDIAALDKDLFEQLHPYLSLLRKLLDPKTQFEGKERKYGLDHDRIVELLGAKPADLGELIEKIERLSTLPDVVVTPNKVSGLPKEYHHLVLVTNSEFRKQAKKETEANLQGLACNFLLPLLKILNYAISGCIRISPTHTLTLTYQDGTHRDKLKDFSKVILLDATGDKLHLEKVLGTKVLHIEQYKKPLANVKVTNVNMVGLGSGKWSEQAQGRVAALTKQLTRYHPDLQVISLKQYANGGGYWFHDNRGTNRYKGVSAIAAFGKPLINLGVVKDEYRILYGNLDGFEDYYKSLMQREILQLIGRQRAHLFPDRHFNIYICAPNLDLSFLKPLGVKMAECEAFELCDKAGTQEQFRRSQLISAIKHLIELDEPISQKKIAEQMDVTQGYISQLCDAIAGGWHSIKVLLPLYIGSYKDTNIFQTKEIKDWILGNLDDYLVEWLELIATEGLQAFNTKVLSPQPLQIRGLILAVLYSLILQKDDICNLSKPPPS